MQALFWLEWRLTLPLHFSEHAAIKLKHPPMSLFRQLLPGSGFEGPL
jgi:hypothetical protein